MLNYIIFVSMLAKEFASQHFILQDFPLSILTPDVTDNVYHPYIFTYSRKQFYPWQQSNSPRREVSYFQMEYFYSWKLYFLY